MADRRKSVRLAALVAGVVVVLAVFLSIGTTRYLQTRPIYLRGAVIRQSDDPTKESPITDVAVSVADGLATSSTKTAFNGFFSIRLLPGVHQNESVTLRFLHPDYQPLELTEPVGDKLYIAHLVPMQKDVEIQTDQHAFPISNILIRYSTVATAQEIIGTAAKTFQIPNVSNIPCNKSAACSPDGRWKAADATESLDAGEGNVFRNARVSCIAGPCPFTKIDADDFSQGGREIKVTVRDWSDTTTFLFQAEVFHTQIENVVRVAYPVILGRSLNFTLPPSAEGPSIDADVNGENIVFPLGPNPVLSWADCNVSVDRNQAKLYRCDLNSGYRFQESK